MKKWKKAIRKSSKSRMSSKSSCRDNSSGTSRQRYEPNGSNHRREVVPTNLSPHLTSRQWRKYPPETKDGKDDEGGFGTG
jgi:hypothetical protein